MSHLFLSTPARIAPEILCHTEKIAPGTVAMAMFGKAEPAREVARPEFCMPISMATAFLRGRSILKRTATKYFGTVVGDDGCYDEADGGHRDSGQEVRDLLGVFAEEFVDQEAEADGDQDDLDDGQEHGLHVNADGGAQVEVGERGRQEGREQGVDAGHAYGQGCVAAGQVGDDVAGGASGAGSDQDYADEQFVADRR